MRILDNYMNILPTFVIGEGARNNIYLARSLSLPDYRNHYSGPENLDQAIS
jgi:type IV secretory pathway VirB10-like protein